MKLAKTSNELDRLMAYSLGEDVVTAMLNGRIGRVRTLESAALKAFTGDLEGPEVEQMRCELIFLRDHGLFFFAYLDNLRTTR